MTRADGAMLHQVRGRLVELLVERYGGPPWNEGLHENEAAADSLVRAAGRPEVVTAAAWQGDELVGVAQGGPGSLFRDDLDAVSPATAGTLPPTVFELWQLVVARSAAGRRLGAGLHDLVMGEVEGPALLLTHPASGAALRLYERRGWVVAGRTAFGEQHPRVILLRR